MFSGQEEKQKKKIQNNTIKTNTLPFETNCYGHQEQQELIHQVQLHCTAGKIK